MVFWPYLQPTQMRSCWDPGNWGPGGPVYLQGAASETCRARSSELQGTDMLARLARVPASDKLQAYVGAGSATSDRMAAWSSQKCQHVLKKVPDAWCATAVSAGNLRDVVVTVVQPTL